MKTANPDFSSVERTKSVAIITEESLYDMKKYQLKLIDYLCYEINGSNNNAKQELVLSEIKSVEKYLKWAWGDFMHDKNRKINY